MKFAVLSAAVALGVSIPSVGAATDLSAGCRSIATGNFNQSVAAGASGTTINGILDFKAGETIVVDIVDAGNSLFALGTVAVIFSGDTGTKQQSYTFGANETGVAVAADIQATASAPASIAATCSSPSAGSGSTDILAANDAGLDAIDTARPSISVSTLKKTLTRTQRNRRAAILQEIRALGFSIRRLEAERNQLEDNGLKILREFGLADNLVDSLAFAEAQIFGLASEETTGVVLDLIDRHMQNVRSLADLVPLEDRAEDIRIDTEAREKKFREYAGNLSDLARVTAQLATEYDQVTTLQIELDGIERAVTGTASSRGFALSSQGAVFGGSTQAFVHSALSDIGGASNRDGRAASLRLGLVHEISPAASLGYYLSYFDAETTQSGPSTKVESEGLGLGMFLTFALSDSWQGGLSVFHEDADVTSTVSGATGNFGRTYTAFEAEVSRTFALDAWQVTPSLSFGQVTTETDSYTDSAGTAVSGRRETYSTAAAAVEMARSFDLGGQWATQMDVFGGLGIEHHGRDARVFSNGTRLEAGDTSGAISFGTAFHGRDGGTLRLDLGASGLGSDATAVTLGGRFDLKF